jgi:endonuclease/exonuclease/phosphatase family metal-dependent hydrolase
LDILDPANNNTVTVGDFNAASPNWGYTYKNATGKAVEEFLAANTENFYTTQKTHQHTCTTMDMQQIPTYPVSQQTSQIFQPVS